MSYTPTDWENLPSQTSPLNKTNFQKMDNQIAQNTDDISGLDTRVTTAEENISNFNLTTFEETTSITASGTGTVTGKIYIATNNDNSLAKIYGAFTCNMSNPRKWK